MHSLGYSCHQHKPLSLAEQIERVLILITEKIIVTVSTVSLIIIEHLTMTDRCVLHDLEGC